MNYYLCPIIFVTFVNKSNLINVTTIMGQRKYNFVMFIFLEVCLFFLHRTNN